MVGLFDGVCVVPPPPECEASCDLALQGDDPLKPRLDANSLDDEIASDVHVTEELSGEATALPKHADAGLALAPYAGPGLTLPLDCRCRVGQPDHPSTARPAATEHRHPRHGGALDAGVSLAYANDPTSARPTITEDGITIGTILAENARLTRLRGLTDDL